MQPVMLPVAELKPHPKNARTHSRAQITAIGRALQEWGFLQPLVVDEDHTILIGHGRWEAAKSIGLQAVPAFVREGLSDAKKRALIISDNRLAEVGSRWDEGLLGDELRYLLGADYDVTLTAFELVEPHEPKPAAEPAATKPATSRPGDIWLLGPHRLACADGRTVAGAKAACGHTSPLLLVSEVRDPDPATALVDAAGVLQAAVWDVAYLWHRPEVAAEVAEAIAGAGAAIRAQIVRCGATMPTRAPGKAARYRRGHDPCWYAVRAGATADWQGGRNQSTVWEIEDEPRPGLPVGCWSRAIVNHLVEGGAVYDPAAGAGQVLIAAQRTARVALAAEANPALVDRAVERWQVFTGKDAIHAASGETYTAIAAEAEAGDEAEPDTEGAGPAAA